MDLKELKKHRKGVQVVMPTPFNRDGSLDLEGMRANARWLIEHFKGRDCIFTAAGGFGEGPYLSIEECQAIIKMLVEEVNGRFPVYPSTGRACTLETIRLSQYAQSVGADAVQTCLPYYYVPQEEGVYLHHKQIAESLDTNIGIMIYNNSQNSGSWISPSLLKRLSEIPNIILLKNSTPLLSHYLAWRSVADPADIVIFQGLGEIVFATRALYGCPGFVSTLANFAPDLSYSVYEAASTKDFGKLSEIIDTKVKPFFELRDRLDKNHGPHAGYPSQVTHAAGYQWFSMVKAAMDIIGLRGGEVRLPLVGLTDKEKAEVRELLRVMKVI